MRLSDIKPYLITRNLVPENQESPVHFITNALTPEPYLFRRNHFPYPILSNQSFFLSVGGKVPRPLTLHYQDLLRMPYKKLNVVLECSGNNRGNFRPRVFGEQWEGGAISQGVWKGVVLSELLKITGISDNAKEIVFEGHDFGKRTDLKDDFPFARSLPLEKALHPDTIIAYELNGKPIPYRHGYPFRLIVPQWYAMASIKWLCSITVIDTHFNGPFQDIDYVYYLEKNSAAGKEPVTTINVNSIIQQPLNWSVLDVGIHQVYGIAWTGAGFVEKVQISLDGGDHWERADIQQVNGNPYGWIFWTYTWVAEQKGVYAIMSRATDSFGNIQPAEARWNRKGYGYNAYSTIHVKVE